MRRAPFRLTTYDLTARVRYRLGTPLRLRGSTPRPRRYARTLERMSSAQDIDFVQYVEPETAPVQPQVSFIIHGIIENVAPFV